MHPLSFSSIKAFLTCPHRYKLQYIDNKPQVVKQTKAMEIGSQFHKVLETIFKYIQSGLGVDAAYERALLDLQTEITHPEVYALLRTVNLTELFKDEVVKSGAAELHVGLDEDLAPASFEDAAFRGIFDLVWLTSDALFILDYKTNQYTKPDPLQFEFYAFLGYHYFKPTMPIDKVHVMVYYAHASQPKISHRIWEKNEVPAQKFIELRKKILHNTDWEPRPGPWCATCPVAQWCILTQSTSADELTPEQLAQRYMALKTALKNVEELLKEALQEHNRIELESATVELAVYQRKSIKPEAFVKRIIEKQLPPEKLAPLVPATFSNAKKLGIKLQEEDIITSEVERIVVKERGARDDAS